MTSSQKQIVKSVRLSQAMAGDLGCYGGKQWQNKLRGLCAACADNYDKRNYAGRQAQVQQHMDELKASTAYGYDVYIRLLPVQYAQLTELCVMLDGDFGKVAAHRLSRALEWLWLVSQPAAAVESPDTTADELPHEAGTEPVAEPAGEPATASLVHAG